MYKWGKPHTPVNFCKLYRMDVYCVKEKRFTPNVVGSETFATARNGKRLLKVKCASCGITKTRFVSAQEGGNILDPILKWTRSGLPKKKREELARAEKRMFGGGVLDTVGNTAAEAFFEYGVPYLAKQGVKQGRYFASEFLRQPEYQKKLANKAKPIARKAVKRPSLLKATIDSRSKIRFFSFAGILKPLPI